MIDASTSRKAVFSLFTLSSVDSESWLATWKMVMEMHRAYEHYVIEEAIPFIKHKTGWFDGDDDRLFDGAISCNSILPPADVFTKVIMVFTTHVSLSAIIG